MHKCTGGFELIEEYPKISPSYFLLPAKSDILKG